MGFDLEILEYDKIKTTLQSYAQTNDGKDAAKKMTPSAEEANIQQAFKELKEAYQYVIHDVTPGFGGIHSLSQALNRVRIGAAIDPKDFMNIAAHIEAAARLKREIIKFPESIDETYSIMRYAEDLIILKTLKASIDAVFDRRGLMKDTASNTLQTLRKQLNLTDRKIKETLEQTLNKESGKLTEKLFTIRYERYVIPVKLSDKNNVKGTVLDYSSSGETVFIEPEAIQKLTAKKLRLTQEEKQEVERILLTLTQEVAQYIEPLNHNTKLFTHLDLLFAKARYGYAIEGSIPVVDKHIRFYKARHPLIAADDVVANTITFDENKRMMVITGSNTGGKTVTLKTIGLLTLMAQSGMMIPALQDSTFRIFKHIRADIGDEQSIEQSLSTFSSHLKRIVDIVDHYDDDQLILLDELGSGTDPKEGSSLAMSILHHLATKDSVIVATTHYPELKAFAYTEDYIMNASVEFDETSLKPTYKLLLRVPGESHAFLISKRLGLKSSIIDHAKSQVLTSRSEVSSLIDKLKKESKQLDDMLQTYERKNAELSAELETVKQAKKKLQQEKETLKEKITLESNKELKTLRDKAKAIIAELDHMKQTSFKEHELAEKKHSINALTPKKSEETSQTKDHTYQVGDTVYILKYNRYGELAKRLKDGMWSVDMGALSSTFHEDEFEYSKTGTKPETPQKKTPKQPKKHVQSSLDLRGMRVHEAQAELEKYLDDCALSKQPYATIIHGFGTLALRKMVKETLNQHALIDHHRDGENHEGGQGATVVYFEG